MTQDDILEQFALDVKRTGAALSSPDVATEAIQYLIRTSKRINRGMKLRDLLETPLDSVEQRLLKLVTPKLLKALEKHPAVIEQVMRFGSGAKRLVDQYSTLADDRHTEGRRTDSDLEKECQQSINELASEISYTIGDIAQAKFSEYAVDEASEFTEKMIELFALDEVTDHFHELLMTNPPAFVDPYSKKP